MIKIQDCCQKYSIQVRKVEYSPFGIVLFGDSEAYLLRVKDSSKKELFSYLESIHYPYFVSFINSYGDSYELYPYFEDKSNDSIVKSKEIVDAMSLLHLKSMYFEEASENDLKEIYEAIHLQIQEQWKYYFELQDYMEEFSFPRVDYYYLLKNISLIYRILSISKEKLDRWYQKQEFKIRKAYVLHNACLENFRMNDVSYFLDFHECSKDILVYDFFLFYQKEVSSLYMEELFEQYDSKLSLSEAEFLLFCSLICIPPKIEFGNDVYQNTVRIQNTLEYVDRTLRFLSEEDKKYQKADEEELKE